MWNSNDSYSPLKKVFVDGDDDDIETGSVASTVALTPTSSQNQMSAGDILQIFNSSEYSLAAQTRLILPFGEITADNDNNDENENGNDDDDRVDSSKHRRHTYRDNNNKSVTVKLNHKCAVSSTCSRRYAERCTYALIFLILLRIQGELLRELVITGERGSNFGERGEGSRQLPPGTSMGELHSFQAPNVITTSPTQYDRKQLQLRTKSIEKPGLHVVVSHCDKPLEWIWNEYLKDDPFKSLTVLSRCGHPPSISDLFQTQDEKNNVVVVEIPNVGRWDHSYSYYIQQFWDSSSRNPVFQSTSIFGSMLPNDQVLFLNGEDDAGSINSNVGEDQQQDLTDLSSMREKTSKVGFSCSLSPTNLPQNMPLLRDRAEVPTVLLDYSDHRSLKKWLDSLGTSVELQLTEYYVPVCFDSRRFMTTVKRILFAPVRDWSVIVKALESAQGDNTEGARYMERLWAALLSLPMDLDEKISLKDQPKCLISDGEKEYLGLVIYDGDKNAKPAKSEISDVGVTSPSPPSSSKTITKKKSGVVRFGHNRNIQNRRPKRASPFKKGGMKKS